MIDRNRITCRVDVGELSRRLKDTIGRSYRRAFLWDEALSGGLRPPQYGALFGVMAYWSRDRQEPATVVMPTGTGKTDTMIALFVAGQIPRLIVVVPTDPLRDQIADKFLTLGILPSNKLLRRAARMPVVGRVMLPLPLSTAPRSSPGSATWL